MDIFFLARGWWGVVVRYMIQSPQWLRTTGCALLTIWPSSPGQLSDPSWAPSCLGEPLAQLGAGWPRGPEPGQLISAIIASHPPEGQGGPVYMAGQHSDRECGNMGGLWGPHLRTGPASLLPVLSAKASQFSFKRKQVNCKVKLQSSRYRTDAGLQPFLQQ